MPVLSSAALDALASDTQRIGILFRLATDPPIRLWLGIGDCEIGINAYDATAAVYSGLGQLINVPQVNQLLNGLADRVTFEISGVSQDVLSMASQESAVVKGKSVVLGMAIFDASWQQLGDPVWLWFGVADFVAVNQQTDGNAKAIVRSIELSVGSMFTGRRRRGLSYLTDRDQQARSPGDKICERTVLYTEQSSKVWPRF